MAVHIVYTRPMQVVNGQVIDKEDATIAQMSSADMEMRVMSDSGIPSSANNPTVKAYLEAEEAAGFRLGHIDNMIIVTYD